METLVASWSRRGGRTGRVDAPTEELLIAVTEGRGSVVRDDQPSGGALERGDDPAPLVLVLRLGISGIGELVA